MGLCVCFDRNWENGLVAFVLVCFVCVVLCWFVLFVLFCVGLFCLCCFVLFRVIGVVLCLWLFECG